MSNIHEFSLGSNLFLIVSLHERQPCTLTLACFHRAPHCQYTDRKQPIIVKAGELAAVCFASQMNI